MATKTNPGNEKVTARIMFKGVMLMCIDKDQRCEVGFIKCPNHQPAIDITTYVGSTHTTTPLNYVPGHDLIFKVSQPSQSGVHRYRNVLSDSAFSKVIDLEGTKCHHHKIGVHTDRLNGRLGVTDGKLYSYKLTANKFDLMAWNDPSDPGSKVMTLGKIAETVGLNIYCRNTQGAGIDIIDATTGVHYPPLPAGSDVWYEIGIDNDCTKYSHESENTRKQEGTDFRYFYSVVDSPDRKKFDLRVNVSVRPKPFPGVCETVFLGKTEFENIEKLLENTKGKSKVTHKLKFPYGTITLKIKRR